MYEGGDPLQGAIVSSDTGEHSTTTGSNGYYTLSIALSHHGQTVKITASCSGYKSYTKSFTLQGGESITQDFWLDPS
jgi:hypothetical protein